VAVALLLLLERVALARVGLALRHALRARRLAPAPALLVRLSFPKLAKRFGNAHPGETPSPLRRTTTSNAIPRLTRPPPKRSFASRARSQSAALTLGTRVKRESKTEAGSSRRDGEILAGGGASLRARTTGLSWPNVSAPAGRGNDRSEGPASTAPPGRELMSDGFRWFSLADSLHHRLISAVPPGP